MLSSLSADELTLVLRQLPFRDLQRCEAVSRAMRFSAASDTVWQPHCHAFWPDAALCATVHTFRELFRSANGWQYLVRLPHAVVGPASDLRGARRRSAGTLPPLVGFDVAGDVLVTATGKAITLRSGDAAPLAINSEHVIQDVKLLPGGTAVLALCSDGSLRTVRTVAQEGCLTVSPPIERLPDRGRMGMVCPRSHLSAPKVLVGCYAPMLMAPGACLVDIAGGQVGEMLQVGYTQELRSVCVSDDAREVALGCRAGSRSLVYICDTRQSWVASQRLDTHHANVVRIRLNGEHGLLASHARSKEVKLWDRRKLSGGGVYSGGSMLSPPDAGPRQEAADAFHCVGNAPDFDCLGGELVAVSGGAPGTSYGAKLHVFSTEPRRLRAEANLPEVVIDDRHRLRCSVGVKLESRAITLVADEQRLIRCWVP